MILFFLCAAILVAICVAVVGRGLLVPASLHDVDLQATNLSITRQRVQELEKSDPSSSQAGAVDNELAAALLDDLRGPGYGLQNSRQSGRMTSIILLITIPLTAAALYQWLGNKQWLLATQAPASQAVTASANPDDESFNLETLLGRLEQALVDNPDNADGWALAGRTYMSMGNFAAAENAYRRVQQLVGDDPDVLTAWADASLMVNGGNFTPDIAERIDRALALDPNQTNALWIAAMGSRSNGDLATSRRMMERLRPLLAGNPQAMQQLDMLLGDPDPNSETSGSAERESAANDQSPGLQDSRASQAAVTVHVSLSDTLRDSAAAADTVFVFARAVEGPPMPLAALRTTVAELPLTIVLDQSRAMIPQQHIGTVDEVTVTARVAKGGTPVAKPGDLTSTSERVSTRNDAPVTLVIDALVE